MNVPWQCACGIVTMVDLLDLETRDAAKVVSVCGYECKCGEFVVLRHTSVIFREAERKLLRYQPFQEQYQFLLKKLIHKAQGMFTERGIHDNRDRIRLP